MDEEFKKQIGGIFGIDSDLTDDWHFTSSATDVVQNRKRMKLPFDANKTARELKEMLARWDRAELEALMSKTDFDWFSSTERERQLKVILEALIHELTFKYPDGHAYADPA